MHEQQPKKQPLTEAEHFLTVAIASSASFAAVALANLERIIVSFDNPVVRYLVEAVAALLLLYMVVKPYPSRVVLPNDSTARIPALKPRIAACSALAVLILVAAWCEILQYKVFPASALDLRSPGVGEIQGGNIINVERGDAPSLRSSGVFLANQTSAFSGMPQLNSAHIAIPFQLSRDLNSALILGVSLRVVDYQPMPPCSVEGSAHGLPEVHTAWFELKARQSELPWDFEPSAFQRSNGGMSSPEESFPFLISGDSEQYVVVHVNATQAGVYYIVPMLTLTTSKAKAEAIELCDKPLPLAFFDETTELEDAVRL